MTKTFTPKSVADWRSWLEKNHLKESKIILIKYKKHTGKPLLSAADLMKEAICFGWIDTTARRIDDDRYSITYMRRNGNSKWSINTLSYGKALLKLGNMSSFGIKMYKDGLKKKAYDHHIPKNPEMPLELENALKKFKLENAFDRFPPSIKRMHYRHILYAKLPETRQRRILKIIQTLH